MPLWKLVFPLDLKPTLWRVQTVFSLPRAQARSHWRPMHWQKRRPLDKFSCWNHAALFAGCYNLLVRHFLGLFNLSRFKLQLTLFLEYVVSGFGINLFLLQSTHWASVYGVKAAVSGQIGTRANTIPSVFFLWALIRSTTKNFPAEFHLAKLQSDCLL